MDPRRIAVVTGSGRGIGKSIALAFARHGVTPIVADIDGKAAEETVAEIAAAGVETGYFVLDVSDVDLVTGMIDEAAGTYGSVDILVNNAGILSTTSFAGIDEDEWDRTMAINLKSAVFAAKAVLRHMKKRKWGRIINVSSMAGRMGGFSTGCAYTASKAALIGVTMNIARQVAGDGITVNAVAPGTANTEMALGFSDEDRRKLEQSIPVGRLVEPDSIAETVAFLASDAAAFITGAVIDINGGMFMG